MSKKSSVDKNCYETYTVTTGIYKSLGEAISAGNYDRCNPNITCEYFSLNGRSRQSDVEITLVYRNKVEWSKELLEEFVESEKYRNIRTEEILALGAQYPELQREIPIIALGTVVQIDGECYQSVLALDGHVDERVLSLVYFGGAWSRLCRFAFVRKI